MFRRFAWAYSCSFVLVLPRDRPEELEPERDVLPRDRPEELEPEPDVARDLVEPDVDLDREPVEPELVLEREPELVVEPFELEPLFEPLELFVREVEPLLRDRVVLEPDRLREPEERDELRPPPERRAPPPPPPSPSPESSESSLDPSSFLPTPTAAAVARPTAAPVATFFGVESPSFPSSSDAMVSPPSVPR
jgi:hypothetical protein